MSNNGEPSQNEVDLATLGEQVRQQREAIRCLHRVLTIMPKVWPHAEIIEAVNQLDAAEELLR